MKIDKIFQKIYLLLGISYIAILPLTITIIHIIDKYIDILSIWHMMTFVISIFTFLAFILENIIYKSKIKKFKSIKFSLLFFSLFFICAIISTILSNNISQSFFGDTYRANGLMQFLSYIGYALLGISLNKKNRIMILRMLIYTSFIMALIIIFGNSNTFFVNYYPNSGIFFHFNHYAYYLVYTIITSIFLFFHDEKKILKLINLMIYITLIYMLVINDTFGCYLAVLSTIIIIFIYCLRKKIITKFLFIIIPFIFISLFVKVNNEYLVINNFKKIFYDFGMIKYGLESNENIEDTVIMNVGTNRGQLWYYGFEFVKEKPIFGYGLDNLENKYLEHNIDMDMPHNLILGLSATIGIPGMLFYFLAVFLIIIKGLKKYKINDDFSNLSYFVIFAHLISSMFGNTMYYVTPYYVIILGMGMLDLNEDVSNN